MQIQCVHCGMPVVVRESVRSVTCRNCSRSFVVPTLTPSAKVNADPWAAPSLANPLERSVGVQQTRRSGAPVIALLGLMVSLGVAAAGFLVLRMQPATNAERASERGVEGVATEPPAQAEPVPAETPKPTPAIEPSAPPPTPAPSSHQRSQNSRVHSDETERVSAPTPGAELAPRPSASDVRAAIRTVESRVRACVVSQHGNATALIRVTGSTGTVASVSVQGDFAGRPEGACIANAVRNARFAPFAQDAFLVTYPFRF